MGAYTLMVGLFYSKRYWVRMVYIVLILIEIFIAALFRQRERAEYLKYLLSNS